MITVNITIPINVNKYNQILTVKDANNETVTVEKETMLTMVE